MRKTIVITAGGTAEEIDNVRTITNMSTGKLGATICNKILSQIPEDIEMIYYICSSLSVRPQESEKVEVIIVKGTYDLKEKIEGLLNTTKVDVFIHSMAVSDYTTDYVSSTERLSDELTEKLWNAKDELVTKSSLKKIISQTLDCPNNNIPRDKKMSSSENGMVIKLKQTPKVISFIKNLQPELLLIGFKLLSGVTKQELKTVAFNLLQKNNCDYVVANDLMDIRAGSHDAIIINQHGGTISATGKDAIANTITNIIKSNN